MFGNVNYCRNNDLGLERVDTYGICPLIVKEGNKLKYYIPKLENVASYLSSFVFKTTVILSITV